MGYALTQTVAPTEEPLELSETKDFLKVCVGDDDTYIAALITAARQYVEQHTSRQLVTATWRLRLDSFADKSFKACNGDFWLPHPPLLAVSSITYYDTANASQTLSSSVYAVNTDDEPGRIRLVWGQTWPTTYTRYDAVTITYTAGYGAASAVPQLAKQAMRMLVGHWYENRQPVIVGMSANAVEYSVASLLSMISTGQYT